MNDYQREQWQGQRLVQTQLKQMPRQERLAVAERIADYFDFRNRVDRFLGRHCSEMCTKACFQSHTSACCSRDGIITFWADLVINAVASAPAEIERLSESIQSPDNERKCIYLGADGCRWRIRPLVCAMFLCDRVQQALSANDTLPRRHWEELSRQAKRYRWPDRPVLFDDLERVFIDRGCHSPLMYLHNSPGLLRVKQKAGLSEYRGGSDTDDRLRGLEGIGQ